MHVRKKRLRPSQLTRKPLIGKHDSIGYEIGRQHPRAFIIACAEVARDVGEGHICNAGIEHFHECSERTATPMIHGLTFGFDPGWSAVMPCSLLI